jgi:hypothetical protein
MLDPRRERASALRRQAQAILEGSQSGMVARPARGHVIETLESTRQRKP